MPVELPDIGLGTAHIPNGDAGANVISDALDVGFRFLDTAQSYDTESEVGDGLARSAVPREEVVVATKIHQSNLGHDDIHQTALESADLLGLETIDLVYVHWPLEAYDPVDTFDALAELVDDGLVEHVGVCNFTPDLLAEAREASPVPIVAHQVEFHPLLDQSALLTDAVEHEIPLVAYGPLIRGEVFDVPELTRIAAKHDATPAQVSLAWLMDRSNVVPIPGIEDDRDHLRENFTAQALSLDDEDRALIDSIEENRRYYADPRERRAEEA